MSTRATSGAGARALAVVAAVALVISAAVTLTAYAGRDGGPAAGGAGARSPGRAFPDGQLVVSGGRTGASVEVPARRTGWTVESRDTVVYYVDRRGEPAVGVSGAAVLSDGYCRQHPDGSDRGFVGFTRPVPGTDVREAATALARRWVRAVALHEDLRTSSPHTPLRTREVTLADGTPAVRSTARVLPTGHGPCAAPSVVLTLLSFDTGGRGGAVATLVMVRDAGAAGDLSDAVAERILRTVRRSGRSD